MDSKNRLLLALATATSLTGLVSKSAWSGGSVGMIGPAFETIPTALLRTDSTAGHTTARFWASAVAPAPLESARITTAEQLSPSPIIVLHSGEELAVLPQRFGPSSPAALVNAAGNVSARNLAAETVVALKTHPQNGDIFDGANSKAEGSAVSIPDAPKPFNNKRLAAAVSIALKKIKSRDLTHTQAGYRDDFSNAIRARDDVYDKSVIDTYMNQIDGVVKQLILAGHFEEAAQLVQNIIPADYWPSGSYLPYDGYFYAKREVDTLVERIQNMLRRR